MSYDTLQAPRGGTFSAGKAGLAAGTTAGTYKTTGTALYGIKGLAYSIAATDNLSLSALASSVQAADTTALYAVMGDTSSGFSVKVSASVLNTDLANGIGSLVWPTPDAGKCLLGFIKVKTVAVTFTPGTTSLAAAGVTATYYDVMGGAPTAQLTS